jgi:predicted dehydrogenase
MNGKKIRIASIGVGMIGHVHEKILSRMQECDYTGIADFDPQALIKCVRDNNVKLLIGHHR